MPKQKSSTRSSYKNSLKSYWFIVSQPDEHDPLLDHSVSLDPSAVAHRCMRRKPHLLILVHDSCE